MTSLEQTFLTRWRQLAGPGAPPPQAEYQFMAKRRFRFDFAWPELKIAVELEGGTHAPRNKCCPACGQPPRSRHTTGEGYARDCEKYNLAASQGWTVFRAPAGMLQRNPVGFIEMIRAKMEETSQHH